MGAAFLSDSWFRVAALCPRLRHPIRVSRQRYRGKPWYVVHDPLTNRVQRFSPNAWWLASQFDGGNSVDGVWQRALRELGDHAPSQDEVIGWLAQLHQADLLVSQASPDAAELLDRKRKQDRPKWLSGLVNPLSVRLPLWDPDAFLGRTLPLLRGVFTSWGLAGWLALVLPALFLAGVHWEALSGNLSDRLLSSSNLLSLLLVYPLVKLLHELGHGWAVKAGGGEVHEAGVMLLVFAPTPYVDASASNAFRSKHYRAFVAAAGMMTELALAACAMYAWLLVEPGVVRTLAFNVMAVAGISTLLFNGNPLLRYDGYYILCDLAELPNLGQRANNWWSHLVRRHAFGQSDATPPDLRPDEQRWLCAYAPAAFAYRIMVSLSIALFVADQYFFVGVLMALWSVAALLVLPAWKALRFLLASPALGRQRPRALLVSACAALAFGSAAAWLPLPHSSVAEAVVWVPHGAEVRAAASGFVRQVAARPAHAVGAGERLFVQEDQLLEARFQAQLARVEELDVQTVLDQSTDRGRFFQARQDLAREQGELDDLVGRVAELETRALASGMFVRARGEDLPGSWVRRGDLLGYIVAPGARFVRAVVRQDDIDLVRTRLRAIEIMPADRIGESYAGRVLRAVPQADERLPSKALTVEGGGELVADPTDPQALRTLDKVFQFDLAVDGAAPDLRIGTRAWVRFRYAPEPLFGQCWRRMRQLLLARLHV